MKSTIFFGVGYHPTRESRLLFVNIATWLQQSITPCKKLDWLMKMVFREQRKPENTRTKLINFVAECLFNRHPHQLLGCFHFHLSVPYNFIRERAKKMKKHPHSQRPRLTAPHFAFVLVLVTHFLDSILSRCTL